MPESSDRDRKLACQFVADALGCSDEETAYHLTELLVQARREGREEGIREALGKVPTTWLDPLLTGREKVFDHKESPEMNVQNVLQGVRDRITLLLHQPAPEGEETP